MCCGNRDFISSLLVSVDQQEFKRLVALWSSPNKALFILFGKEGRSSHGKHLIPAAGAEHSSRAISKVLSAAELHWDVLTLIYTPRTRTAAGILVEQDKQFSISPISPQVFQDCSFPWSFE